MTFVVVGILLWLLNNYVPMDGKIKQIINSESPGVGGSILSVSTILF
jgi:hypothetical protein